MKDSLEKKKNYIKLSTLQTQKVQKISTIITRQNLHFAHAPNNENKT